MISAKESSRKQILEERNKLSENEIKEKSKKIQEKLENLKEYKEAKTIMFYVSFSKEVYTHDMIKEALRDKTVCIPVVDNGRLIISKIDDFSDLDKKNKYGILEPSKIELVDNIDVIIVPGLAFDSEGNRIGYGEGYYDAFLKNFKKIKIGLCFDFQVVDEIPKESHDVRMDKVITEKRIISCS